MLSSPKKTLLLITLKMMDWSNNQFSMRLVGITNIFFLLISYLIHPIFMIGFIFINFYLITTSITDWCPLSHLFFYLKSKRNRQLQMIKVKSGESYLFLAKVYLAQENKSKAEEFSKKAAKLGFKDEILEKNLF
jgi:hypothetical protein